MKIQEWNWPILGIGAGIIAFWVIVILVLSQNVIFREIISWLITFSTGQKLF
ncbi:MAG: hypothetical protein PHZ04_00680 [Patescibacteria group bacterium]|nr:hypothetical protein [Patescibacteria group bacterium]MDD5554722.1 hypothetical protein [Patescibacteria group bacterium]